MQRLNSWDFPLPGIFGGTPEERQEKNSGLQQIYSISWVSACPYTEFCLSAVSTSSPHVIHTQNTPDRQEFTPQTPGKSAQPSRGGGQWKTGMIRRKRLALVIPELINNNLLLFPNNLQFGDNNLLFIFGSNNLLIYNNNNNFFYSQIIQLCRLWQELSLFAELSDPLPTCYLQLYLQTQTPNPA